MKDDSIDMVILHIDMGYLVTLFDTHRLTLAEARAATAAAAASPVSSSVSSLTISSWRSSLTSILSSRFSLSCSRVVHISAFNELFLSLKPPNVSR